MSLSSLPGKEGAGGLGMSLDPGEPRAGATHGLVLYQRKVLVFLVMVLTLLPRLSSGSQKSSSSQNGPFLQFPDIFTQGRRPLTLQKAVCKLGEGGRLFRRGKIG